MLEDGVAPHPRTPYLTLDGSSRPCGRHGDAAACFSYRSRVVETSSVTEGGVLSGLRVIDAGTMIGGPFTGTLAADYGADVIKIERPDGGDPIRQWSPLKDGVSLWWKVTARNKRLVTLDLRKERGRVLFLRLVESADAVIENYRPGTLDRWGLSYAELSRTNPRVIVVRVSGYGQTGPYAHRPGYGTVAEAMTGLPSFTGFPDKPPTLSAFPLADTVAASFALVGLLSAVYERDVAGSGRGQEVDVSLYEPVFRLAESQVIGFSELGIVKQRRGNRIEEDSPRNAYETADGGYIAISASSDRTFARLAQAIEKPELADDPRFRTNASRIANDAELDAIVAAWMRKHTTAEAMAALEAADVVAGKVYDVEDIFADPHYAARRNIVDVPDLDFGSVKMPGVVPRFSRSPSAVRFAGGQLGQHNEEVYRGLLGLSADELELLRAEGVI
jgi:succinyl-CoA---D-citramalate CoA-transferase